MVLASASWGECSGEEHGTRECLVGRALGRGAWYSRVHTSPCKYKHKREYPVQECFTQCGSSPDGEELLVDP